jgi:heparanase
MGVGIWYEMYVSDPIAYLFKCERRGATARRLLEYTRARACPVAVWELGNEINGFVIAHGFALRGADYAADMAVARAMVDEVDPDALLAGPADIYWPVWGEIVSTLPAFLATGGGLVDIVTWHYYPQQSSKCEIASRRAAVDTLLDPRNLDEISRWAEEVESLRDAHAPRAAVWLDETGHALCGGEPGLSDRFVTGFWWLDQLGLVAARGQPVVVRQTLTGGRYQLIDNASLAPSPDYFNSLLWKRLMGERSLRAVASGGGLLRVYAHCTPARPGAITALAINLDPERKVQLSFDGIPGEREVYLVTGPDLISAELRLNGVSLAVADDGSVPPLPAAEGQDPVVVPPLSYAFVVLPAAAAPACP